MHRETELPSENELLWPLTVQKIVYGPISHDSEMILTLHKFKAKPFYSKEILQVE